MLLFFRLTRATTEEVKGTAVSLTWLNNIIATSQMKLRGEGDELSPNRKGISIDAKLVLMLVLPIPFANLKATDLAAVSKLCCGCCLIICTVVLINNSV
jgi:hypothetical protein